MPRRIQYHSLVSEPLTIPRRHPVPSEPCRRYAGSGSSRIASPLFCASTSCPSFSRLLSAARLRLPKTGQTNWTQQATRAHAQPSVAVHNREPPPPRRPTPVPKSLGSEILPAAVAFSLASHVGHAALIGRLLSQHQPQPTQLGDRAPSPGA